MKNDYDWKDEATVIAAQCWRDDRTKHIEMDVQLAEVFAETLALYMQDLAQSQRNTDYYRGLLIECGESIGDEAYRCDDGSFSKDVLIDKIPSCVDEILGI